MMPGTSCSAWFCRPLLLRHRRVGFSLVELLLVVVLMVVVAGLSIPNLPQYLSIFELDQTMRHMSYLMRYAQSLAVVHQKIYRCCFSQEQSRYWLEEEAGGAEQRFQKVAGEKGRSFSIPRSLALETEQACICFYPDGTIDRTILSMQNKGKKKRMISTQERRGQVDVFSPTE